MDKYMSQITSWLLLTWFEDLSEPPLPQELGAYEDIVSIHLEDEELNAWTFVARVGASARHAKTLPYPLETIGAYEKSKYKNVRATKNAENLLKQ